MQDLISVLERIALTLEQVSSNQSQILQTLESIDGKLGVGHSSFGLDDIHGQLTLIDSSLGSIDSSLGLIDSSVGLIDSKMG